jgi:hypothetical protein
MHMYVYCPYNDFKNKIFNSEIYYSNMKIDILVLKLYLNISKNDISMF